MQVNALDFVEGFRGEVAFATVGAADNGDIFDDKEGLVLAVAVGSVAELGGGVVADVTRTSGCL